MKNQLQQYCSKILLLIIRFRLDFIIRIFIESYLISLFSKILAFIFIKRNKSFVNNIECKLKEAFPELKDSNRIQLIALNHIDNVIWTILITSCLPLLSPERAKRFIDTQELQDRIRDSESYIFLASHFYNFILGLGIYDILTENKIPSVTTYNGIHDSRLNRLRKGLHKRSNNTIVALGRQESPDLRSIIKTLSLSRFGVIVFGDFSGAFLNSDYKYYIGKRTFCANRGTGSILSKNKSAAVVPIFAIRENKKIKMKVLGDLQNKNSIKEYYEELLPQIIKNYPEHWLLWFSH